MNRNAFRDALIAALWLGGDLDVPGHCELVADIVLAMPEIQALLANEAEIKRLRAAGDALAEESWNNRSADKAVKAWWEARLD